MAESSKWMLQALELAKKGNPNVSPNPMVGCVIVKENKLIASGYHRIYGGAHAEAAALRKAGARAKNATLYVTLEPCTHYGKTPPCCESIIKAGIKEVVIAGKDPNPINTGKSLTLLRKAGIKVRVGMLSKDAARLNAPFFKYMKTGLPYVTLKMAQTLDGKIATKAGRSEWITSEASRKVVHQLRAESDAVFVGKGTWMADNPSLTVRKAKKRLRPEKPWRVILDPKFEVSEKSKVFEGLQHTVVVISEKYIDRISDSKDLIKKGIFFLPVPEKNGRMDLKVMLKRLAELGVMKLLVEGGAETAWTLLKEKLVDDYYWFIAPKFWGGKDSVTSVEGKGVRLPSEGLESTVDEVLKIGPDVLLKGRF